MHTNMPPGGGARQTQVYSFDYVHQSATRGQGKPITSLPTHNEARVVHLETSKMSLIGWQSGSGGSVCVWCLTDWVTKWVRWFSLQLWCLDFVCKKVGKVHDFQSPVLTFQSEHYNHSVVIVDLAIQADWLNESTWYTGFSSKTYSQ